MSPRTEEAGCVGDARVPAGPSHASPHCSPKCLGSAGLRAPGVTPWADLMLRCVNSPLALEKYICYAEQTRAVLAKLADHGKKMFLITNSPSSFV